MELMDLDYGLKAVAASGHVLNLQQQTCIQAGLTMLRSRERCDSIYFWGRIYGEEQDYYMAYALKDSDFEFPSKQFFFATEDFEFKPLPQLTEEAADRIIDLGLGTVFKGRPDEVIEGLPEGGMLTEDLAGNNMAAGGGAKLTEADRLAQAVQEIDFDTSAAPRGAFKLTESHRVVPSANFRGLGVTESTQLGSYVHLRPPTSAAALRALARSDAAFYGDFLDPLDGDLPKGCWAVRRDPSTQSATLRSLIWPGYVAYHAPGTDRFGGLYFGDAQKSRDLPFIL